ncbi:DIE2/ALG10 family-domain-containing protein [Lasiosphaeria miniovina]|uniref:Dol-P-Glc:Glc(2)Man(9)GlcNAc(2)-PP-Dol alpha-1,2-glucosyltransferase n=1 Tax=Lasiosphaeria miniovina TaxID=1954250 RepID=A0AA40AU26_9PEZI|nr:DIE2/ALG10 family-domain-containing protein [Lasiosphaeria miniovina]KAK0721947.1 DIE2/ALG10 family-domain-containing protein [Lasiosphaeria miniovina]
MPVLEALIEGLQVKELLRGLGLAVILARCIPPVSITGNKAIFSGGTIKAGGFFLVFLVARSWLALVNDFVPEPYLDEVFHVPQAQTYCAGRYWEWDDKITTPPGLYLLSVACHKLWMVSECSTASLRTNNLLATLLMVLLATLCRGLIEARAAERNGGTKQQQHRTRAVSVYAFYTGLNIALFPVLFFFSALYYTDVVSTLLVLIAYRNHLLRVGPDRPGMASDVWTVVLGVAALLMRQTNVFWVVVYMGGLEAVHAVRSLTPVQTQPSPPTSRYLTLADHLRFYLRKYSIGEVHDPPLNVAWPDDWLFCLISIAISAVCNPLRVLRQVWPHIAVLALFAGFVAWNGGVVLGDKANHIATIHLAQMLYIWPFFAFFSAPLLLPSFLPFIKGPVRIISRLAIGESRPSTPPIPPNSRQLSKAASKNLESKADPPQPNTSASSHRRGPVRSLALTVVDSLFASKYVVYVPYVGCTVLASLAVVRFNTIVHPFTLADNRHYMFYVFRYTILRSARVRYGLVAAYTASRWLVWSQLAGHSGPSASRRSATSAGRFTNPLFPSYGTPAVSVFPRLSNEDYDDRDLKGGSNTTKAKNKKQGAVAPVPSPETNDNAGLDGSAAAPPPTSTALLWLLATALSLVTAPLVEPRYFILPWVFWRLLVPAWPWPVSPADNDTDGVKNKSGMANLLRAIGSNVDVRLVLETGWFLAVNLGTMYMFLFRPFFWRSADGGEFLDGGRVQRFMW